MSITNHDCTPYYYWYRTTQETPSNYHSHYINGHHYLLFADEPSYQIIDKLNLVFIGGGDINYLKKAAATI